MSNPVNKGQQGWESQNTQGFKSEFSTNRQKVEGITTEQSLDIIQRAERDGVPTRGGNGKVYVPESTTLDGTKLSLRVAEAKKAEDAQKANPNTGNPFMQGRKQGPPPPIKDLTK